MSPMVKVGAMIVVIVGFAALLQIQQLKIKRLVVENADLRSQLGQIASLQDTNESLAQQLKAAIASSQTNQSELLRLRGQGARSRQLERENAQLKSERQQLALQTRQSPAAVASSEQPTALVVSEPKISTETLPETDLGPLDLQDGIAVQFDLGGGTNCVVTPTALSDGNNIMQISLGVANADGTVSELGISRITARPGQHCSISVGDRMIGLAVTLRPR